ncbi:DNA-binding GntR family transcriptional regulator [Streptacidiphilus sp. MAP12-16]|uniref:GntR family transcriptional regulator n=1 Tax=Streptacidiphilus sp. MAP12-16 TaxID=3156300 RepID=UPI003515296C
MPGLSGRSKAYEFIRDTVLADPEMLGRFVNEQAVADRIAVSRTPVREALLLLAAEDLVQLVPRRGAYVAPLSGREVSELMELRSMVESHAAQRILDRGLVPVEEMQGFVDQQAALRSPEASAEFIRLDHDFHMAMVRAAGNSMMTRMYEGLRAKQVRCGLVAVYRSVGRQDAVLGEHRAILDALVAGGSEAAVDAINAHLQATQAVLLAS